MSDLECVSCGVGFCNTGFSLSANSLTTMQEQAGAMLTFMGLIVLGRLGLLVVTDLPGLQVSRLPSIRSIPWLRRYNQRVPVSQVPVQTRLSAVVTGVLILVGRAGLGVFGPALCDPRMPLRSQMFEMVSALSTAGISTGITTQLSAGSQLILCLLMFIGRVGPVSVVLFVVRMSSIGVVCLTAVVVWGGVSMSAGKRHITSLAGVGGLQQPGWERDTATAAQPCLLRNDTPASLMSFCRIDATRRMRIIARLFMCRILRLSPVSACAAWLPFCYV